MRHCHFLIAWERVNTTLSQTIEQLGICILIPLVNSYQGQSIATKCA